MYKYSTIIGVIELRQDGIGYRTISSRYEIGSSAITLSDLEEIMSICISIEQR